MIRRLSAMCKDETLPDRAVGCVVWTNGSERKEWCACAGFFAYEALRLLVVPKWGSVRWRSAASEGAGCQRSVLPVAKNADLGFQIKGVFVTISMCGEQRRWSADVSRDEGEGRTESNPLSGITCGLPAGSCGVLTAWRQRSPALMAGFRWRWFQREIACRSMRTQERQIAG